MKNLFLSPNGLLKNVFNKLEIIQSEQRHNRSDISLVLSLLNKLVTNANLQKQVDEFFEDDETSPQTDQDEQ